MIAFASARCRKKTSPRLKRNFTKMLPEILHHSQLVLRGIEPPRRDTLVSEIVADAFFIFERLAERGLSHLAYPRPLVLAALLLAKRRQGPSRGLND